MDKNIDLGNINIMVVTEIIGVEEISLRHFIIKIFFLKKGKVQNDLQSIDTKNAERNKIHKRN